MTGYTIEYGPSSGNYLYSAINIGKVGSFTVNGLSSGCFVVRALNGCAVGDPSNEVCTGAVLGGSRVLGATTLGTTGTFGEGVFDLLFTFGSFLTGLGVKLHRGKIS